VAPGGERLVRVASPIDAIGVISFVSGGSFASAACSVRV